MNENDEFRKRVYEIVADIPNGFVLTYGTIALLTGRPQNPRMVGKFMSQAPKDLPSYRVVNHMGKTVSGWNEQRIFLENEGVVFNENGCVNLRKHLWKYL